MATYLVTGGAGFIGSHIAEALLQRGDHVRVLDNFSTGKRSNLATLSEIDVIEGDIRDEGSVRRAMAGADYVIHQAAMVSVSQSMTDPAACHAINAGGTLSLLQAAREHKVQRFVLASSCAVYGDNDSLPLSETSSTQPLSPYAATKLIGEVYCQTFYRAYQVPTVCLRYFNVYGPRQDPNGEYAAVIPKFAQRLRQGTAPIVYGDGRQTRDFVFVADIVRANLLACTHPAASGQIFNLATETSVSLLDLIRELESLLGTHVEPDFRPPRTGDIVRSRGQAQRIAALLGFHPEIDLRTGLSRLLAAAA
jgi:nucleoside-diphosphate-sugar epimerase